MKKKLSLLFMLLAFLAVAQPHVSTAPESRFDFVDDVGVDMVEDASSLLQQLIKKFDGFGNLQTWVKNLDEVADARVFAKLDALNANDFKKLDADLVKAKFKNAIEENPELMGSWKRLLDLGRNQMRSDPDILKAFYKTMNNPHIPSDRLDNIIKTLSDGKLGCKTCPSKGKEDLRFIHHVLADLDAFATEFNNTPGFDDFLRQMGQQGSYAIGNSWTLKALIRNRSKYFDGATIIGFEIEHVPNRKFAVDVLTIVGENRCYTEFKNWGGNLLGKSNMVKQLTGTMQVINKLDEMKFIFNPSRWTPTAKQLKKALQAEDQFIGALSETQKMKLFGTIDTNEIIDMLTSDKYFNMIIKTK